MLRPNVASATPNAAAIAVSSAVRSGGSRRVLGEVHATSHPGAATQLLLSEAVTCSESATAAIGDALGL